MSFSRYLVIIPPKSVSSNLLTKLFHPMRFLSFLPMLLLLAGSLGAQNQCSIFDLNATVSPIDPATCQYYIALNFQHTGTTNQYTVKGNGVDYGTFSYDSVPVKLGPFTAGTSPSVKELRMTLAPARASSRAVPSPMPELEPVTIAVFAADMPRSPLRVWHRR